MMDGMTREEFIRDVREYWVSVTRDKAVYRRV
jgi:hypothetical protein